MWDRAGNIGKLSTWTIFQAVRNSLKTWPWSTTLFAICAKLHPVRNRESKEPNVEIWKTKGNFLRKMKIKESISAAHLQLKDEFRVKCCSWCTEVAQTLIVQTRNSPKSRNFYNLMSIAKGRVLFLLIASDSYTWGSLVLSAYFPSVLRANISKPFSWNRFLTILILNMGWKLFSYKKSCFEFEESRENSFKLNFASEDISQQIFRVRRCTSSYKA